VDSTRLFLLTIKGKKSKASKLSEFKIGNDTTELVLPGCTQLHFTPDSTKLIAASIEGSIYIVDMTKFDNGKFKLLYTITKLSKKNLPLDAKYGE
jgi:hypothetical protein